MSPRIWLSLSVAANFVAALYIVFQPSGIVPVAANASPVVLREQIAADAVQAVEVDYAPPSNSPSSVAEYLRKAGVSPSVRAVLVRAMLDERYKDIRGAVLYGHAKHKWQRSGPPAQGPEVRAKYAEIEAAFEAEVRSILGDDYEKAKVAGMNTLPGFEGLSEEKLQAILKIRSDNAGVMRNAMRDNPGADAEKIRAMVEAETEADLRAVMTPAEFAQYEIYQSPTSRELVSALRGVDLDDAKFSEIVGKVRSLNRSDWPAAIQEVAGDSVTIGYLKNFERTFTPTITALQASGMSDAAILRSVSALKKPYEKGVTRIDPAAIYTEATAEMTPEQQQAFAATKQGARLKAEVEMVERLKTEAAQVP